MPRDPSTGVYTASESAVNPAKPRTQISSSAFNELRDDIQAALNGVVLAGQPQTLENEQKEQARANIAAVAYDPQSLTDEQKEQARENVGLATTTTDNAIPRFDGTTGATQNSGVTISDANVMSGAGYVTSGSSDTTVPGDNTSAFLELINTASGQGRGGEVSFSRTAGDPFAVIRGELVTGPSPYSGDLAIYTREAPTDALARRLTILRRGSIVATAGDPLEIGGFYSFGAVNSKGYQGFISKTKTSYLTSLSPGEYSGSTTGGYFVGINDLVGDGNPGAWGTYTEVQVSNNLWGGAIEASAQNTAGIAPRISNPNSAFGTGSAPSVHGVWISNIGTSAPFGAQDVTSALTVAGANVSHPGKFSRGIVVDAEAIQSVSGHKQAVLLPSQNDIAWWDATGANIGYLTSNGTNLQWTTDGAAATMAIGTTGTPKGTLDVRSAASTVAFVVGDSTADATTKIGRITGAHYTNSEEPIALIASVATNSSNEARVGGGYGQANAATSITFYTAANFATTTGTSRATINSAGVFSVLTATAATSITTGSLVNAGGFGNAGAGWFGGLIDCASEIRAGGDTGGAVSRNTFTNGSDLTANSTGVGSIKFKGATSRDSSGFIKIYVGTTAYYVPVFAAITG